MLQNLLMLISSPICNLRKPSSLEVCHYFNLPPLKKGYKNDKLFRNLGAFDQPKKGKLLGIFNGSLSLGKDQIDLIPFKSPLRLAKR